MSPFSFNDPLPIPYFLSDGASEEIHNLLYFYFERNFPLEILGTILVHCKNVSSSEDQVGSSILFSVDVRRFVKKFKGGREKEKEEKEEEEEGGGIRRFPVDVKTLKNNYIRPETKGNTPYFFAEDTRSLVGGERDKERRRRELEGREYKTTVGD